MSSETQHMSALGLCSIRFFCLHSLCLWLVHRHGAFYLPSTDTRSYQHERSEIATATELLSKKTWIFHVRVWDTETGLLICLNHNAVPFELVFYPDFWVARPADTRTRFIHAVYCTGDCHTLGAEPRPDRSIPPSVRLCKVRNHHGNGLISWKYGG